MMRISDNIMLIFMQLSLSWASFDKSHLPTPDCVRHADKVIIPVHVRLYIVLLSSSGLCLVIIPVHVKLYIVLLSSSGPKVLFTGDNIFHLSSIFNQAWLWIITSSMNTLIRRSWTCQSHVELYSYHWSGVNRQSWLYCVSIQTWD